MKDDLFNASQHIDINRNSQSANLYFLLNLFCSMASKISRYTTLLFSESASLTISSGLIDHFIYVLKGPASSLLARLDPKIYL